MFRKLFRHHPALVQFMVRTVRRTIQLPISVYAACICFFILLAIFPTVILICAVLRSVGISTGSLLLAVRPFLPQPLFPLARELMEGFFSARSIPTLSLTALLALWSASRGIYGIMLGLNAICGFTDQRSFIQKRLICLSYLSITLLSLPAVLAAHMMGYALLHRAGILIPLLQYAGSIVILALVFTGIYRTFPAKKLRLRACFYGSLLTSFLWQLFTALFSLYALHARTYSTFYGSLRFCALGLLWLYFCMMILLWGGFFSAEIHERYSSH